ncbi:MAG: hypothetical protein U9Q66_03530, partial [Patescibacteria group bacterium]|nr:hypothetical protein [Patescibacteria group bacterium]
FSSNQISFNSNLNCSNTFSICVYDSTSIESFHIDFILSTSTSVSSLISQKTSSTISSSVINQATQPYSSIIIAKCLRDCLKVSSKLSIG